MTGQNQLDFVPTQAKLEELTNKLLILGEAYREARESFGDAKNALVVLLIPKQDQAKYQKASFEKQLLLMLNETLEIHRAEVYQYHEDYVKQRDIYKGLDKQIETITTKIMTIQSLMKWQRQND